MTIRLTWQRVAAALAGLAALGMAFAWSGLFNVAASSGHWAVTDWFLHWVMRNSVKTHAAFATPEQVSEPGGMVSAAGHFANACASCHGAPGVRPLPMMQRATPPAPDLAVNVTQWTDRHLFWILEHGVKYSGMPAWAAQHRPDEIRRMVYFLRRLPGMSGEQYRALVEQAVPVVPGVRPGIVATCVGCHGADGRGRGQGDIPILGGQRPEALYRALVSYRFGRRESAVMANPAATLRPDEMRAMAAYFAGQPGLGAMPAGDARAAAIVTRGLPERQLPACASCHGAGGSAPRLGGQRAGYIADRLRAWRGDEKVIDARQSQATMPVIARRIPEDMIVPLARYLEGRSVSPGR